MQTALAESAARRSQTYWLLARLVLERPSMTLLAELDSTLPTAQVGFAKDEPLAEEVAQLVATARVVLGDPTALETLEVDYTRLFAGLSSTYGAPAPFESLALESRLMGDSTLAVEGAYRNAGLDPSVPEAGPPDHLGVELRFLSLVCFQEMEAWQAGDSATAAGWIERERCFLDEHLLVWVPMHCERLAQVAQTPYYRAVASLLDRACRIDREDVTLLLELTAS